MYDSGDPEESVIFDDLVRKCIRGQNITPSPQMFRLVQQVLQGDAKAKYDRQTTLTGSQNMANFR